MNSTTSYDYLVKLLVIGDSGEKTKYTHPVGLLGGLGLPYLFPMSTPSGLLIVFSK